ncbi:Nudix hydrolase 8 [Vitis vinifera]|uniref:Nudix hydrolase 8 n=1 Tax=Vitis vinifera TaxID=29760 RepID=A0A438K322_VITVI|nr:Nudix hydrolase 8 [Vitis vinifera]
MELKLFDSKSVSVSDVDLVGRPCSSMLSNSRGGRIFPWFCSYRGKFFTGTVVLIWGVSPKVSYSNTSSKAIQSVGQEKLGVETFSYRFNGTNGTRSTLFSREMRVLDAIDDEYGGVVVDPQRLPVNPSSFATVLHSSLSHWKMQGKKGVWLKLPAERSELVPIAVKEGFQYHHAERGYVMLTYWIPEGPCMLPSNASHHVGVGGFVINDNNEVHFLLIIMWNCTDLTCFPCTTLTGHRCTVYLPFYLVGKLSDDDYPQVLVVQEKHYAPALVGLWKIPTGFILEAEEISTGVVREIKEETGIDTEFVEVIAFRHAHNVAFEKSDLFFVCMLRPLSTQIAVDDIEIQAAKWMPLDEFVEQPLIQGDCMFKKIIDICIARLGKRYCGLSAQQLVSKFDGKLSSLYYNVTEAQDLNCQGL